ncbi:MAG: glutathione S-transferase [Marinobacter sp. T13-3]|nr:MAG: glutathione S-transferase [Marinobacter sp. T13-3]
MVPRYPVGHYNRKSRIYLNATSPYARVARIAAMEKGLEPELVWVDPWSNDEQLLDVNPMARVPVLVTDEGQAISESLLVLQYLDGIVEATPLFPESALASVLQLTGLAQGLIDASFGTVIQRKHEGDTADNTLLGQRRLAAIKRTLAGLEKNLESAIKQQELPAFSATHIVTGVALEYLDFRLPEIHWRESHPALVELDKEMSARASFARTAFA